MADLDRMIQTFYAAAFDGDWEHFRAKTLAEVCDWLGASGAGWLTRSAADLPGEYTEHPAGAGASQEQLLRLRFEPGEREKEFNPLPAELAPAGSTGKEHGNVFIYQHRGGALTSIVLLRYARGHKPQPPEEVRRAIGHMVEAATLALRSYIQRDEWLLSLGRPSRGSTALVDARGAIYAASSHFRDMLEGPLGTRDFAALSQPLPPEAIDNEGSFFQGVLHFRSARRGNLYLLHARKPLPLDGLSPREQEIARALGKGKTFKSVARQCGIAVSTVANHASRIYKKLGIFRREELVEMVRSPGGEGSTVPGTSLNK